MAPSFRYEPAAARDLDELVQLRVEAMRESLERLGRFDPARARERFAAGFEPDSTRFIVVEQARVGFLVVKRRADGLLLDHLYLSPAAQGRGLGGAVLKDVLDAADGEQLALHVGALRGSDANRFYLRHGFRVVGEGAWDIYYRREARSSAGRPPSPGQPAGL
jgi:GNAT superfamily N-acetyltransferase